MLKINLYGAPSSGKSTLAGQVFGHLKGQSHHIAFVQEYAKELVYQGMDMTRLSESDRIIILGEQFRREKILENQVEMLITDSPLLLTAYYHRDPNLDEDWSYALDVVKRHLTNNEVHFWLESTDTFEIEGRSHSQEESLKIDNEMKLYLSKSGINFHTIKGNPQERLDSVIKIVKELI
jgi:nicotinamide riboside kinase